MIKRVRLGRHAYWVAVWTLYEDGPVGGGEWFFRDWKDKRDEMWRLYWNPLRVRAGLEPWEPVK